MIKPSLLAALLAAMSVMAAQGGAVQFDSEATGVVFTAENGTVETALDGGETVFRWKPVVGQTATLALRADLPLFERLRSQDRLDFEFRIRQGRVNGLGLEARGFVSGARRFKVHEWGLAMSTTPGGVWIPRMLDLARPNWFPWDNPDGESEDSFFRFNTLAIEPGTVIEFRRLRASPGRLLLKPDFELPITWPVREARPDGGSVWRIRYQLQNASGKPDVVHVAVLSPHTLFKVSVESNDVPLKAGVAREFVVLAVMDAESAKRVAPLAAEPLRVSFSLAGQPDVVCEGKGELVAPLPAGTRRQVVMAEEDRLDARAMASAPTGALAKVAGLAGILKKADEFRSKKLVQIPHGHQWPGWPPPPEWKVGDSMAEITNALTGEREFGTDLAGMVWKRFLEYPGFAAENTGLAYLMTGDESYAKQAIAYFDLLGRQYGELPWCKTFEQPWNGGVAILCASRISNGSSYGGAMFMKNQSRLLSMVAESPSWTDEQRKRVYEGFVLPYTHEIMKFYGGMNNMTDIGNHNVLLMGLAFGDAGLVRWALLRDSGLINRLTDIDADGFSGEGRPVGYQTAAMAEYLPSLAYLDNSGLKIPFARDHLLESFRMPFRRAALNGRIPNTGDCARWLSATPNPHIDSVLALFPAETWLETVAGGKTLPAILRRQRTGRAPAADAWKSLLETQPRLFSHAGMAILRRGDTAETQVMATLDYGLNIFHGHLDRLQVTLHAFNRVFTHGPGSLYNVGKGGMSEGTDPRLKAFLSNGSLSQNVILSDGSNQMPSVGRLLAWSDKPDYQVAAARVDGLFPGVAHTRCLVLTEGLVVMLDRIESDTPHAYDFVYHNLGTLALGAGWTTEPEKTPLGAAVNYDALVDVKKLAGSGVLRLDWDLSGQLPASEREALEKAGKQPPPVHLDLWQVADPGGEAFTAVTGLNNPNTLTIFDAAPTLIRRVRAPVAAFATVLAPYGAASPVKGVAPLSGGGCGVTLADGRVLEFRLNDLLERFKAGPAHSP